MAKYTSLWMFLLFLITCFLRAGVAERLTVARSCQRKVPALGRVEFPCGWWLSSTCHRFESVLKDQDVCCEGTTDSSGGLCEAVCSPACVNGGVCVAPNQCVCPRGYQLPNCGDIDECQGNPCPRGYNCSNTNGSFLCLPNTKDWCQDVTCSANAQCKVTGRAVSCECNDGYRGDGFHCLEIRCPELRAPASGSINVTGDQPYRAVAAFSCWQNHTLVGTPLVHCEYSGSWSNQPAACVPKATCTTACGGHASCVTFHPGISRCRCDYGFNGDGFTCKEIRCPAILALLHGRIEHLDGNNTRDKVHFSCDPGYRMDGTTSLTCTSVRGQDEGKWSPAAPTCTELCGPTGCSGGGVCLADSGSAGRCQCAEGHTMADDTCEKTTCPPPAMIANGDWDSRNFSYNTALSPRCDPGFYQPNRTYIICDKNGNWTGSSPSCEPIQCDMSGMSAPVHGSVVGSDSLNGLPGLRFSCNHGYNLVGLEWVLCKTDGTWSGPRPTCHAVSCRPLDSLRQGSVNATGHSTGDVATFTCKAGFRVEGPTAVQCMGSGQWNDTAPFCKAETVGLSCSESDLPTIVGSEKNCSTQTINSGLRKTDCVLSCAGNQTFEPSGMVLRCQSDIRGWRGISGSGQIVDAEVGRCVAPEYPLVTRTLQGLVAELPGALRREETLSCLETTFNNSCGSDCQVADINVVELGSARLVEVAVTLSEVSVDRSHLGLSEVDQQWKNAAQKLRDVANSTQAGLVAAGGTDCAPGSLRWLAHDGLLGSPELACPPGRALRNQSCYSCPEGTFNQKGWGRCEPCPVGSHQSGTGAVECTPCPNGKTTQSAGSRDLDQCQDFAECNCGPHPCELGESGYTCRCGEGFSQSGPTDCTDIDECEQSVCSVNSDCFNLPGSYVCVCHHGYAGEKCEDVDECRFPDTCSADEACVNTPGSFVCTPI